MSEQRNAFKLGLAMIVFIVLFVGVLVFLAPRGGGDVPLRVRYPHTEMSTVLKAGGLVRCGGATVGSISGLELMEMTDPKTNQNALYSVVGIRVDSDLNLRNDCSIVPAGPLLGEGGQLVIADRGMGKPLVGGELIDGTPGSDIGMLMKMISDQLDARDPDSLMAMIKAQLDGGDPKSMLGKILVSLDDLNVVTKSISNEFDVGQRTALLAKLHMVMDDINQTTGMLRDEMDHDIDQALVGKLHRTLDTLHRGLTTVADMLDENRQPIQRTVAHIEASTEILEKQVAAQIARQLNPEDPAGLLAKVHVSIDRLGKSLEDINAMTSAAREVIVLNKDQLDTMLSNFRETSDHLKAAAKEIRRSPWRLFYQPTMEEATQANVFDAARAFSDAATRLDAAIARLQAVDSATGQQLPSHDEQLLKIRDELKETFGRFTEAETALWEKLKIK